MSSIFRNPIFDWFVKYILSKYLELKNKSLKIGYLSYASNCGFGKYVTLYNYVNLLNTELSDFSYISDRTRVQNTTIGKFCSIGPDCRIGLGEHPVSSFVSTHPLFYSKDIQSKMVFSDKNYFLEIEPIVIENDVWIGANVVILDGINISHGAVVAAGSVVTKNVPSYAVVGGIPAKVIKYRYNRDVIKALLDIQWWDFNIDDLIKNYKKFHNINDFIEFFSKN